MEGVVGWGRGSLVVSLNDDLKNRPVHECSGSKQGCILSFCVLSLSIQKKTTHLKEEQRYNAAITQCEIEMVV